MPRRYVIENIIHHKKTSVISENDFVCTSHLEQPSKLQLMHSYERLAASKPIQISAKLGLHSN